VLAFLSKRVAPPDAPERAVAPLTFARPRQMDSKKNAAGCREHGVRVVHLGKRSVVMAGQTVELHDIAELGAARHELELYLNGHSLPAELTYDLLTCVQEASKNALRFAATPCGVHVSVTVDAGEILVTVCDHGAGLDLGRISELPPDPLSESGRGLFLLRTLMDEVEFRVNGGTEVRLRKRLT